MTRGIYFLANDRTLDHAIALVNSIRHYDTETPLLMIPYDEHFQRVAKVLAQLDGVSVFDPSRLCARLLRKVRRIFGDNFFPRPNNFRKQLCWFGPFDEWLYLDADIVVLERIVGWTHNLDRFDLIVYSDQHLTGIEHVFKPSMIQAGIFDASVNNQVFNAGMWGGRKGSITERQLYDYFAECACDKGHLDRAHGGSDQPVFNYIALKHLGRRMNLYQELSHAPGMWAGDPHLEWRDGRLYDLRTDTPCKFLHWAGIRLAPDAPYWEVWQHFRFMNRALDIPLQSPQMQPPRSSRHHFVQRQIDRVMEVIDP